jgi:shikimate dehydrogenase
MRLTGETRLLGVIGHPITHSLSPRMHNASFAVTGLDYVYVPLDVRSEALPTAVAGLATLGFRGFNVTMPHKVAILPLLDDVDAAAGISGAVNTVVVEGDRLLGINTDGPGFLEACGESGIVVGGASVLVAGGGGGGRGGGERRRRARGRSRPPEPTQPERVARRGVGAAAGAGLPDGEYLCIRARRGGKGGRGS